MQVVQGTVSSISVCTCIDEHVEIAFGDTEFPSLSQGNFFPLALKDIIRDFANVSAITDVLMGVVAANVPISHTAGYCMAGNVPFLLTDQAQFDKLTEMHQWCVKTASPVYTMHHGAVYNSRLLLLVGLSFIAVGLDLLEVHKFSRLEPEHSYMNIRWTLDLIPFFAFVLLLLRWENDTSLRESKMKPSFLLCFVYALMVLTMAVIIVFSVWANAVTRRKKNSIPSGSASLSTCQ